MVRTPSAAITTCVLNTTVTLLATVGYGRLSVEGVAAQASVAKTTIYRRWRSKAELVFAAAIHPPVLGPPPDTGTLAGDLRDVMWYIIEALASRAAIEALPGLMADMAHNADLAAGIRHRFLGSERRWFATILDQAHSRGELPARPDPDLVRDLLLGPALARACFAGQPVDHHFGRELADLVARGLSASDAANA